MLFSPCPDFNQQSRAFKNILLRQRPSLHLCSCIHAPRSKQIGAYVGAKSNATFVTNLSKNCHQWCLFQHSLNPSAGITQDKAGITPHFAPLPLLAQGLLKYSVIQSNNHFPGSNGMHFKVTDRLSLELKRGGALLTHFRGKTNRVVLYSVTFCYVEINLYRRRLWLWG